MTDWPRVSIMSRALLIVNIYCRKQYSPLPALSIPNFKSDNGSIVLSMPQSIARIY